MKRALLTICLGWLLGGLLFAVFRLDPLAKLGVGYKTKILCSEVFVAGREVEDILARDFANIDPLIQEITSSVDKQNGAVKGSLFGFLGKTKATYRPGLGCTLNVDGAPVGDGMNRPAVTPHHWDVDINPVVQSLVKNLVAGEGQTKPVDIRAAIIVKTGRIIAQDYSSGFGPDRPMQSWSMAKSVTQAMVAIAEADGLLSLEDKNLMPQWQNDARKDITLRDLLHMSSSLKFEEIYDSPNSDATRMLFRSRDMGLVAANQALIGKPREHWNYSSGTSNLISLILRRKIEAAGEDYHSWVYRKLFGPIGMNSPVFETDANGTFIGSSYLYASPHDWARLGQLYLNDGVWQGRRILPEATNDFASTAAMPGQVDYYGGHWWLNGDNQFLPGLPTDAFYMAGHDGQYVIVIPSKNIVIVCLGITRLPATFIDDVVPTLKEIVEAL